MVTLHNNEEYLYNPGTDLLLNWGNHVLEKPGMKIEKELLSGFLATWDKTELLRDAEAGLPLLLKDAEQARCFFIENPVLSAYPEGEERRKIVAALNAFDNILFMWVACSHLLKEFSEDFIKKTEAPYQKLTECFEQGRDFSALRLSPVNDWRSKRLERILEENHFLYPWYTRLAEISKDTVALISENWPALIADGYKALSFIPEEDRGLVWAYLKNDGGLKAELDAQSRFEKAIVEVLDKNFAVRLLHLSSVHRIIRVASEKYVSTGLMNIAYGVLSNNIRKDISETEISEALNNADDDKKLLAAFCGPGIGEMRRLTAFKEIENAMKQGHFVKTGNLFATLAQWAKHEINDDMLADSFFEYWNQLRETAYETISEVKEEAGANSAKPWETMPPFISGWQSDQGKLYASYNSEVSGDEDAIPSFVLEDRNNFYLPLKLDKAGRPIVLEEVEGNYTFNEFLSDSKDSKRYVKACYKTKNREPEYTDVKPKPKKIQKILNKLSEQEYNFIVIGISSDKDILEKAMSGEKPENKEEASKVIWIIYQPEEK